MEWNEAKITINGEELTEPQSSTLRVAINSFMSDLALNGLGDDEHGITMTRLYIKNSREILKKIHKEL